MSEKKEEREQIDFDEALVIDFAQVEQVSQVFFEESKEILEELDNLILRLEDNPQDHDQVNTLFRKVHTIKGSVGAVPGGQLLGSLAHEFEALLNRIKQESRSINKDCVDLFLKSSRLLKVLAQSLRDKRELFPEELSEVIELITSYGSFKFSEGSGFEDTAGARRFEPRSSVETSAKNEGVWLQMKQLNEFLRLSGELLVLRNYFHMMNQTVNFRLQPELYERRQSDFSQHLAKICDQFQGQLQTVRKEKAGDSFQGLQVLVRQASTELNKSVQFEMIGADLLID
ncbi:MAG: Hpt domain-containing protein, partial [Bdellovibrio sp.]